MKITSEKRSVNYSAKKTFDFIGDFGNFESLLPEDRIENYKFTEDTCSFKIKGMSDLALRSTEKDEYSRIRMISEGGKPFPFHMDIVIEEVEDNKSEVLIDFEGDINPFMKMMVEKPLTNFFNMLVDKLTTLDLD